MKRVFHAAVITAVACAATITAAKADYPERPITLIVPFAAGGGTDTMARVLAQGLTESLGEEVVVVNKGGAAGTIGASALADAKPDGYTIGVLPIGPLTTQPHLRDVPYDVDSFDYICGVSSVPITVAVAQDSPFGTIKDLLAHAKANPGDLIYGSGGAGTIPEVATNYLFELAGVDVVHVPFKGGAAAATALKGGHSDLFTDTTAVIAREGFKPIGLLANQRISSAPDIPAVGEFGYEIGDWTVWRGVQVPKGVRADIRDRLENACGEAVRSDVWTQLRENLNVPFVSQDSEEFEAMVRVDFERFGQLLGD